MKLTKLSAAPRAQRIFFAPQSAVVSRTALSNSAIARDVAATRR